MTRLKSLLTIALVIISSSIIVPESLADFVSTPVKTLPKIAMTEFQTCIVRTVTEIACFGSPASHQGNVGNPVAFPIQTFGYGTEIYGIWPSDLGPENSGICWVAKKRTDVLGGDKVYCNPNWYFNKNGQAQNLMGEWVTNMHVGCVLYAGKVNCLDASEGRLPLVGPQFSVADFDISFWNLSQRAHMECYLQAGEGRVACRSDTHEDFIIPTAVRSFANNPSTGISVGVPFATKVAVGSSFACAILTDATVACWGIPPGKNNWTSSDTAVHRVAGLSDVIDLEVSEKQACAVQQSGSVLCWGEGYFGDGKGVRRSPTPFLIKGVSGALRIFSNNQDDYELNWCASTTDKYVCWGGNSWGQLNTGDYEPILRPKQLATELVPLKDFNNAKGKNLCKKRYWVSPNDCTVQLRAALVNGLKVPVTLRLQKFTNGAFKTIETWKNLKSLNVNLITRYRGKQGESFRVIDTKERVILSVKIPSITFRSYKYFQLKQSWPTAVTWYGGVNVTTRAQDSIYERCWGVPVTVELQFRESNLKSWKTVARKTSSCKTTIGSNYGWKGQYRLRYLGKTSDAITYG